MLLTIKERMDYDWSKQLPIDNINALFPALYPDSDCGLKVGLKQRFRPLIV